MAHDFQKCPKCDWENNATAKFCNDCWFDLSASKQECPKCGWKNDIRAKFCSDCGFNFSSSKEEVGKKEVVEIKKNGINRNIRYAIAIILLTILVLISVYLYTPETRSIRS